MPEIEPRRASLPRPILRIVAQFLMLPAFIASGTLLYSQTVTIKLVNGRNGHPMAASHVNVWVGSQRKEAIAIPTDKNGVARLRLTNNDDEVDIHNRCNGCGVFGVVNPVVKYDDSLRINVGYVLCQVHGSDYSWLAIKAISTKQLLQKGIVMPNTCGKVSASPNPGELTIFVRPLDFWEILKE